MPNEKRDSNESSGSFQRVLDSLKDPLFDPMKDIEEKRSKKKSQSKRKRPILNKHSYQSISLEKLRQASKTMSWPQAVREFNVSKKVILYYCKVFKIKWNSGMEAVTLRNGMTITKKSVADLLKTCSQLETACRLGISRHQMRTLCDKFGFKKQEKPDYKKKFSQSRKQIPSLVELLQMEREMGASRAQAELGLTKTEFKMCCLDAGMDHNWNHVIAKKFPRPPSAPTSP